MTVRYASLTLTPLHRARLLKFRDLACRCRVEPEGILGTIHGVTFETEDVCLARWSLF